jgi:arylsulfatase
MVFIENNNEGLNVWREGFNKLRMAKLFDMYQDPFERGDKSLMYDQWFVKHAYMMYGGTALVAQWLKSFKEFPPRAKPASFNLDEIMRSMTEPKN